jgi:predicted small secreted protein
MRRFMIIALLGLLAGCATVEGLGQDISAGAGRVRNAF